MSLGLAALRLPEPALETVVRGWRAPALLILLCLALYLPGIASLPPTDRDEARFTQATRQMLESHDFLLPRFQDEARNKKPAGIYWLQAASVAVFSRAGSAAIWPYRLPSLLGALVAVLLTFRFGVPWVGRETAFIGAALLAASLGLTIEAHIAKTDAVLLATVVAAQGALGEIYRRACNAEAIDWRLPLLFWVAQGIGLLIKGPVTPFLSFLTVAMLCITERDSHWLREFRISWGLPLAILIAGPWMLAINLATEGAFMRDSIGGDLLAKLFHGQEGHWAPPGTYLVATLITFWPGSLLLGAAARLAWRERQDNLIRLLAAWILPYWVVVEIIPTKLPNYILPVYPALALLAACAFADTAEPRRSWLDIAAIVLWSLATLALAIVLAGAPVQLGGAVSPIAIAAAVLVLAVAAVFLLGWLLRQPRILPGLLAAVLLAESAFALVLPALDPLWLSRGAARAIARHHLEGRPVAAAGFAEPSLVFLLGTGTKLTSGAVAASFLAATPTGIALVSDREEAAFRAALAARKIEVTAVDTVSGLNYSNGRHLTLTLYEAAPK